MDNSQIRATISRSRSINEKSQIYPFILKNNKKIIFILKKKKTVYNDEKWTEKEDKLLVELIHRIGLKWKFLEKYFPDKTKVEIYKRYYKINPKIKKGKFSYEEDQRLVELLKIHKFNWGKVAKIIESRTPKQIRSRYFNGLYKNFIQKYT